jgi:hypothetical protein
MPTSSAGGYIAKDSAELAVSIFKVKVASESMVRLRSRSGSGP